LPIASFFESSHKLNQLMVELEPQGKNYIGNRNCLHSFSPYFSSLLDKKGV
jgi:hypothetical protein